MELEPAENLRGNAMNRPICSLPFEQTSASHVDSVERRGPEQLNDMATSPEWLDFVAEEQRAARRLKRPHQRQSRDISRDSR